MTQTTASELRVGDVFYRQTYGSSDPRVDARYTARQIQRVPIYGFFGNLYDRIQITCEHHLTGPTSLNLGPDEPVWLVD
ncbi:MAG: hypothetical protein LC733_01785 [Actinobacteria bacterium]|nr:hypothetical protein [Actinomycetota bacterium]